MVASSAQGSRRATLTRVITRELDLTGWHLFRLIHLLEPEHGNSWKFMSPDDKLELCDYVPGMPR